MGAASTGAVDRHAKRPRFRFSLRLVFAVVTLCAVLLGLATWQVRRRERTVAFVRALGGDVILGSEAPVPEWLRSVVPSRVVVVDLADTEATNASLARLADLTALVTLKLDNTQITPGALAHLERLAALESLSLAGTGIVDADLAHLARLQRLTWLKLRDTQVTDAGLEHLRHLTALEELDLRGTRVTGAGLQHLGALSGLRRLSLDDHQITGANIKHLERLPRLRRVVICVPRGTGKPVWELMTSLPHVELAGLLPADGPAIWNGARRWEASPAGVAEAILSTVELGPEDAAKLLRALAANWAGDPRGPWWHPPRPKPEGRIATLEGFIAAVRSGGYDNVSLARAYARATALEEAIPALLELLDDPDYEVRRRAVFFLIRIGLGDERVVAAVARLLQDVDPKLRAITAYAFDDSYADRVYGDGGLQIGPEAAKVAVPLLAGLARDTHWDARYAVVDGLESMVRLNPEQAGPALPVLLELLPDENLSVRSVAARALGTVAQANPEEARSAVPVLVDMFRKEHTAARSGAPALDALGQVVQHLPQDAPPVVALLLEALRESDVRLTQAAVEALGRIVRKNREALKAVVPELLCMLEEPDPSLQGAAERAFRSLGEAMRQKAPTDH